MTNEPAETSLIQKYLAPLAGPEGLGLADDAACLTPKSGMDLVLTADTIVSGVHFLERDNPFDIAVKAVTVNLSDLVAKGACAVGYLLALTFPAKPDESWIEAFSAGLDSQINGQLLGGDITVSDNGPLTITVTAVGEVPSGKMVRRSGAQTGDHLFIAGTIGAKAAGLKCVQDLHAFEAALGPDQIGELAEEYAAPLVMRPKETAKLIREFASASLDISDGLVIDLQRLCVASAVGAEVRVQNIPFHLIVATLIEKGGFSIIDAITGGDDYVPLFAVPQNKLSVFLEARGDIACAEIGKLVEPEKNVTFLDNAGDALSLGGKTGYDHFSNHEQEF